MRIGFAGTPEVALPALDALAASEHELVAVITRPDAPAGRGKQVSPSPVARRAAELGIEVVKPSHPRDEEFATWLAERRLDAIAVVAYGALLPQSVLDLVPGGWINLHFSLLPRWRGAAPVQRTIWAGDPVGGVTTFRIVRALDAGPVFELVEQPVGEWTTAGELFDRLAQLGASALVRTMDRIAEGVDPVEQSGEVTVAAKISVADAHVDFDRPTVEVSRQIRATTPVPGAWAELAGERFKIGQISAAPQPTPDLAPGQLLATKRDLLVGTADGALRLDRVQAAGKKQMAGADWARGVTLPQDARLG